MTLLYSLSHQQRATNERASKIPVESVTATLVVCECNGEHVGWSYNGNATPMKRTLNRDYSDFEKYDFVHACATHMTRL